MVNRSKKSSAKRGVGNLGVNTDVRRDPTWNHCVEFIHEDGTKKHYKYVICNFCQKVIKGGVSRSKHHLAGTNRNAKPCAIVPEEIKQQYVDILNKLASRKNLAQMKFEQCVGVGSYFGSGREGENQDKVASGGSIFNKGIWGPMNRYMVKGNASGDQTTTITPPQNAKELCQQV
nr:uncharacterized protein LOC109174772 [Ipomoea trifida]